MQIIFKENDGYTLNRLEYEALWEKYGNVIQKAFEKVTGLPFKEEKIIGIVGDYKSNYAGDNTEQPMLFRYSVRHKLGTIMHELSHRLLLEYRFNYRGTVDNDHELIDLFLHDVIKEAFGEAAADERMNYEMTFPETEIPCAWKKIMKYSVKDRYSLLEKIKADTK